MPIDFLPTIGSLLTFIQDFTGNPNVVHFLTRASIHIVLLFCLSSSLACSTPVRISIPYLWVIFLTLMLTAEMIASLFLRVYGAHQKYAGSSLIPLTLTNSTVSTGCNSFITESLVYNSVLFFHQTRRFHLAVVFHMILPVVSLFSLRSNNSTTQTLQ